MITDQQKIDYYACNFDEIVGLGYNCEISQRMREIFKDSKFEHYLFTWSYVHDRELFIKSLSDLSTFSESEYIISPFGLVKNKNYNIAFHSRFKQEELLNPDGSYTQNVLPAIQELKERLKHLSKKLKNVLEQSKNVLFIIKLKFHGLDKDVDFIEKLNAVLANYFCVRNAQYTLLIVISEEDYPKDSREKLLEKEWKNIKIGIIKAFAPDACTDTGGDILGWEQLLTSIIHNR